MVPLNYSSSDSTRRKKATFREEQIIYWSCSLRNSEAFRSHDCLKKDRERDFFRLHYDLLPSTELLGNNLCNLTDK